MIDESPDAHEKPEASFEAAVAPFDLLFRRRDEHHIEPQRIGAVLRQHFIGIDDVALRFRHDGAVFEHHPLREQAPERLLEADQPDIAQDAGKEAGIQQMQNRVLHTADVNLHRHPVLGEPRLEGLVGIVRIAKSKEVPR